MAVLVAVASSDGKNVDLHFGKAESFKIFKLEGSRFVFKEERFSLKETADIKESEHSCCTEKASCGCSCGGKESPDVALLSDCTAVVAAKFGGQVSRQFEKKAVSTFDISCPVEFALEKLSAYYKRNS